MSGKLAAAVVIVAIGFNDGFQPFCRRSRLSEHANHLDVWLSIRLARNLPFAEPSDVTAYDATSVAAWAIGLGQSRQDCRPSTPATHPLIAAIHSDEAPTEDLLWLEDLERAAQTDFKQSKEAVFAGKASMGVKVTQPIRQRFSDLQGLLSRISRPTYHR